MPNALLIRSAATLQELAQMALNPVPCWNCGTGEAKWVAKWGPNVIQKR
jgi:hypothetical protein